MEELNKLVNRIRFVKSYLELNERDPLLEESLMEFSETLIDKYGGFLKEKLFDIYDDYFEDDEMVDLLNYVYGEVKVLGDEFDDHEMVIRIRASPLRIEVNNLEHTRHQVIWQAA